MLMLTHTLVLHCVSSALTACYLHYCNVLYAYEQTNDCLRHIDRSLGAPINTFVIAAATATDVLVQEGAEEDPFAIHPSGITASVQRSFQRFKERQMIRLFLWAATAAEWRAERQAAAAAHKRKHSSSVSVIEVVTAQQPLALKQ
jgi:hypothetical protein